MKTSSNGVAVIQYFESLELKAYPDPATGGKPYTIGFGTTVYPSGAPVRPGDVCTKEQAEKYLLNDLAKFEKVVSDAVRVPINQGQFDALVSFTYNVGPGNVKLKAPGLLTSTLLRKLNAGDYAGAAGEFKRWNKANGKVMRGLTRRRAAEQCLFEGMGGASAIERGKAAA